jgi:hypothetical protein
LGAASAQVLAEEFDRVASTNLLPAALIGERAMLVPIFRMSWAEVRRRSRTGEEEGNRPKLPPLSGRPTTILWLTGAQERDLNFFLETTATNISLAALPPPASFACTNLSEQFGEAARRKGFIFSVMLTPTFSSEIVREAAALAKMRTTQTALAVERFRLAHGQLPANLNELVPQLLASIPTDPFDGSPLRYRRLAKGYLIYSIDADGRDDGGREPPERKKSTDTSTYDITFTVER